MYGTIRKIHSCVGLALLAFIGMYFFTGYVLVHEAWFPGADPDRAVRTEPLPPGTLPTEPAELARVVKQRLALAGKPGEPKRQQDGAWKLVYFRPGERFEVLLRDGAASAEVTRIRGGFRELMVGFHRLHGYGGGWVYVLWALCYDLASAALLVFTVTGIWMWWKLKKRRALGWVCLGASFSYTIGMIVYLVHAP